MNNTSIEVIEIKKINGGNLKAYVSVMVGDWCIRDWRITQQEGQRIRITPPQVSWRGTDHKIYYKSLLSIPAETQQRIEFAILTAWEKENRVEEDNL